MSQGPEGPRLPGTTALNSDFSLAALMGDQGSNTGLLLAQAWSAVQEGQVEPCLKPCSPPPTAPKIPEACAQLPRRQACSAGGGRMGAGRMGPRQALLGQLCWEVPGPPSRFARGPHSPGLWTPQNALQPHAQASSCRAAGTFCLSLPHVGPPVPCPGDAGRAQGLTPSPACLLTHSCGSQGQNCAQTSGGLAARLLQPLLSSQWGQQAAAKRRPLPRLPLPSPGPRAWTS